MGVLVEVKHLKKYFKTPRGMLHAVDDVSFSIERGKTLGVVGESGCGKSTLGRVVLGLLSATDGEIWFDKRNITSCKGKMRHELRRHMQIIFQDPFSSLDPRKTVRQLIAEPIKTYNRLSKKELHERVYELMEEVGLAERLVGAYPHELDGGRRQRIGVARALALNPQFIVCDDPVSHNIENVHYGHCAGHGGWDSIGHHIGGETELAPGLYLYLLSPDRRVHAQFLARPDADYRVFP